jgi:uncharacterized protein YjbI with pentapeptide repeats
MSADLTDADFSGASLTDADLRHSDLRGAEISASQIASAASARGTISRDGRIEGLTLDAGEQLVVRDDNGYSDESTSRDPIPITVDFGMSLDPAATLSMVFEDDDWGSTISFEPGVSVSLDGTLKLTFGDIPRPADLDGTTFDLFDWDGAMIAGAFDRIVTAWATEWDTANLYTNGQVTLLSAAVLLGDVNLDGTVNGLDVDPFVDVLVHGRYQPEADMNWDGVVNGLDVDLLFQFHSRGSQVVPEPSTLLLGLIALSAVGVVGGCRRTVYSTPRKPEGHAKDIRRAVDHCPHRQDH